MGRTWKCPILRQVVQLHLYILVVEGGDRDGLIDDEGSVR